MFWFNFCFPKAAEDVNSKMTSWRSSELIGYEMRSMIQKNCVALITKHQSPKRCQHFLYFYWLYFYRSVKFQYRKSLVPSCARGRHEKSIKNKRTRWHPVVPYLSGNVLTKFHGKSSNLHTLLIHWNVSRSFSSCQLLTASAAFGKQKNTEHTFIGFYNL